MAAYLCLPTPVGDLVLTAADGALTRLTWRAADDVPPGPATGRDAEVLAQAAAEISAYFAGSRPVFAVPVAPAGTPFQRRVWTAMTQIRYGQTRTYGDLARAVDGVARAVGQACGANPIPIIIPCHRVVAANGRLGGFSGGAGISTKRALLTREGALACEPDLFSAVTTAPAAR